MNKSLFIQIGIILFFIIIFNLLVIPNLKESRLSVEKQQIWSKKIDSKAKLILTEKAILLITKKKEASELVLYNKETGEEFIRNNIPQGNGNKNLFFYSNTSLYYLDSNNTLYKLDTETLDVVWGKQLAVEFSTIEIEKRRDILFVNMKDKYLSPQGEHLILQDLTGQEITFNINHKASYYLNDIFITSKAKWEDYYYFRTGNCVFNAFNKQLHYIEADALIIDSPFDLQTIHKIKKGAKVIQFSRSNDEDIFVRQPPNIIVPKEELSKTSNFKMLGNMKIDFYHKDWYIFTYESLYDQMLGLLTEKESTPPPKSVHCFVPNKFSSVKHIEYGFLSSPSFCFSDKYFIGVKLDNNISNICFLEFRTWKMEQLLLPQNTDVQKLFCDHKNLYIQMTIGDNSSLYALPLDFDKQ